MSDWLVSSTKSVSSVLFPYQWSPTPVRDLPAKEDSLERRDDSTEHGVLQQESARVAWRSINNETEDHETVLATKSLDSADSARRNALVKGVTQVEDHEDWLFYEPYCTLDELRLSASDNMRLRVHSAFDDVREACAVGGIEVPTDVRGEHPLTNQGVLSIVDTRSSHDTWLRPCPRGVTLREVWCGGGWNRWRFAACWGCWSLFVR